MAGFTASIAPWVSVPDLTWVEEPQEKLGSLHKSLQHSQACFACLPLLGGAAVYYTTSLASAKQMGKKKVFVEKIEP